MSIVNGIMEYRLRDVGSKSEGKVAVLICDNGKEYTLYRPGMLPVEDEFFVSYQGLPIEVEGKAEERTGYFCVTSIRVKDDLNNICEKQEKTIES